MKDSNRVPAVNAAEKCKLSGEQAQNWYSHDAAAAFVRRLGNALKYPISGRSSGKDG
jgi:hypothetical protein